MSSQAHFAPSYTNNQRLANSLRTPVAASPVAGIQEVDLSPEQMTMAVRSDVPVEQFGPLIPYRISKRFRNRQGNFQATARVRTPGPRGSNVHYLLSAFSEEGMAAIESLETGKAYMMTGQLVVKPFITADGEQAFTRSGQPVQTNFIYL